MAPAVYVFHVNAKLFLNTACVEETADYTEEQLDEYILKILPFIRLMEDAANSFELAVNKCLHDVEYDPRSGTVMATFKVLIEPGTYPFPGEVDDYADSLLGHILSTSFEDGCYGGDAVNFYVGDTYAGSFDIRERSGLRVELVAVEPAPSREVYEASWRPSEDDKKKIPYSEALGDFREYLEAEERVAFFNSKIMGYFRRGIYGLGSIFHGICKSHFYNTEEERLAAFRRVWGVQTWEPIEGA